MSTNVFVRDLDLIAPNVTMRVLASWTADPMEVEMASLPPWPTFCRSIVMQVEGEACCFSCVVWFHV